MSSQSELAKLTKEIKNQANKAQAAILQRFFKTKPGQYGAGDRFLGLKVPLQRELARKYSNLDLKSIQALLNSPFHEFRLIGLLILVEQYQLASDLKSKSRIVAFYLKNTKAINNWDLVDLSVYKIIGDFLWLEEAAGRPIQPLLDKLAGSKNIWERRMAIVATYAFIKNGQAKETFRLARKLLQDEHDLLHKAVGWMLREVGKRVSREQLLAFLDANYKRLPRTALRYAIEHLRPSEREHYLLK